MAKQKTKPARIHGKASAAQKLLPAVSVIIPMYNAEKYVGECLDSLLAQTFTNFEVIVVDDCSTDSSYSIVESYAEKFGGRLILTALKKNSGNAGYSARNRGFTFARGEYVFFMDSDDMVTKTAFEELYAAAKNFDADVVFSGSHYCFTADKTDIRRDKECQQLFEKGLADQPILTVNDPYKNLRVLFDSGVLFWAAWTKFVRRDFLIKNEITFPEVRSGGDFIWAIELFCKAERYLRISNTFYLYRNDSNESMTRKQRATDKQIATWDLAFISWAKALKTLSDKLVILRENPHYCYLALNLWLSFCFSKSREAQLQVKPHDIYEILRRAMANDSEFTLLIPFKLNSSLQSSTDLPRKLKNALPSLKIKLNAWKVRSDLFWPNRKQNPPVFTAKRPPHKNCCPQSP